MWSGDAESYISSLNALLIAESNLVAAGKDSAMPHLLAIVKELERIHSFSFELLEEDSAKLSVSIPDSKSADVGSNPAPLAKPLIECPICDGVGFNPYNTKDADCHKCGGKGTI